jgi:hypothetical protein
MLTTQMIPTAERKSQRVQLPKSTALSPRYPPASLWPGLSAANAATRSASCSHAGFCIAEGHPCQGKAGALPIDACASALEQAEDVLDRAYLSAVC